MTFIASGGRRAKFQGERIVVMKPNPMVALLAGVWSVITDQKVVDIASVMCEFTDAFQDELPGRPPPRKMEFTIDNMPSNAPIALPLYRMVPAERIESKLKTNSRKRLVLCLVSARCWFGKGAALGKC